jgi:hypothetical protein
MSRKKKKQKGSVPKRSSPSTHPSQQGKGDEPDPIPQPATPLDQESPSDDRLPATSDLKTKDLGEHVHIVRDGMYEKYFVRRADGLDTPGCRHYRCRYLVLDLSHDETACDVALEYAARIQNTQPQFAADLVRLVNTIRQSQ